MRYTDLERVRRIEVTTEKLLHYLSDNSITPDLILEQEPLRWAITTPLYNIGEQAYQISDEFKQKYTDIPCLCCAIEMGLPKLVKFPQ